ncbi:AzlC family ABC transporter permease [Amnibacterium setariae]|uniref:AzlC family ABC transporter permease n=1 Tax=Amnibacterium setariae TaxID=2306585 RepID=UPI0018F77EF3|nr:AzlC family ABC transporter permease [Amnibacterium setariae]
MADDGPFRAGLRIGVGLGLGSFLLAVSFGAAAVDQGWGPVAPVVASAVVFSGSAQFALLTALGSGAGAGAAILSAALINLRFLPMGVALAGTLRGNALRRALEGQAVVDASFVAAHRGGGRFDRSLLLGATLPQWPLWVAGTLVGVLVAPPPELARSLGLDVVFPAFFALLLLEEARTSRRALTAAVLGGAIALGLLLVVPPGVALLGGALAALVGLAGEEVR